MNKRQKQLYNTYFRKRDVVNQQYGIFEPYEHAYIVNNRIKKGENFTLIMYDEWADLLSYHPEYINEFLRHENVERYHISYKARIISYQPQLYKYLKPNLKELENEYFGISYKLIMKQPQFTKELSSDNINSISTSKRVNILVKYPDLIKYIKTSDFDSYSVRNLLIQHPSLVNYFDKELLNEFDSYDIAKLLKHQPDLVNYLDVSKIDIYDLVDMVIEQPVLFKKVNKYITVLYDLKKIIVRHPKLFTELSDEQKQRISINKIDLFLQNPELIKMMDYSKYDVEFTVIKKPEYADYFDYSMFSDYDFETIFESKPKLLKNKTINKYLKPETVLYLINFRKFFIQYMPKKTILKIFKVNEHLHVYRESLDVLKQKYPNIEELIEKRNNMFGKTT